MNSVLSLKKRLTASNTLIVQNEGGYLDEVGFEWNTPTKDKEIQKFETDNGVRLPESYKQFLLISNGATLFKDVKQRETKNEQKEISSRTQSNEDMDKGEPNPAGQVTARTT
ncbi:SMI1/KNR4 family protein [Gorillibacterium timonense]|uniref:SMI1/KNR4 family protein n=1 Tax=Gorillibacterium timonense TaxID=1689269 RepID=UPI00071D02A6|nr:SMI1/KNR4 family protein [Gorillibacterium timonense]